MDSNSFSVLKHGNNFEKEDIPNELLTLIKSVKNDATTLDDVMEGLRDYIWEKKLFDPLQMKVLCKGDALSTIFGVQEFTILEIKKLLEGSVFRLHSNEVKNNPPETMCKDTPPIPFRETAKRKAEEEMFDGKGTEKRHCGHFECSDTLSCAHLKCTASPMLLFIPQSQIESASDSSESVESVQNIETSVVTDSSDEEIYFGEDFSTTNKGHFLSSGILTIAETFEVEFEPNTDSGSDSLYSDSDSYEWDSLVDLDSIITFVCKTDEDKEFWADNSSDENEEFSFDKSSDEDFDVEISEFDLWRCNRCKKLNNPKNRFCLKCFGTREGWLPEKPLSGEKMPPHPLKRKQRLKRKKRSHKDSSKYFKDSSIFPSTSFQEKSSHEDFKNETNDKNEIFLSPFSKISDQKKNLDKKKLCLVCCDKPIDSVMIHGKIGHSYLCLNCAKRFRRCPVCRRQIEKVVYLIS